MWYGVHEFLESRQHHTFIPKLSKDSHTWAMAMVEKKMSQTVFSVTLLSSSVDEGVIWDLNLRYSQYRI